MSILTSIFKSYLCGILVIQSIIYGIGETVFGTRKCGDLIGTILGIIQTIIIVALIIKFGFINTLRWLLLFPIIYMIGVFILGKTIQIISKEKRSCGELIATIFNNSLKTCSI